MKTKTRCKKGGSITRSEINLDKLSAKQVLEAAKRMNKPVKILEKNTHTGETIIYHGH